MGRAATAPSEHTPTATNTPPPMASLWGLSLKQGKPPQMRGLLSSLAPGKKERLQ